MESKINEIDEIRERKFNLLKIVSKNIALIDDEIEN